MTHEANRGSASFGKCGAGENAVFVIRIRKRFESDFYSPIKTDGSYRIISKDNLVEDGDVALLEQLSKEGRCISALAFVYTESDQARKQKIEKCLAFTGVLTPVDEGEKGWLNLKRTGEPHELCEGVPAFENMQNLVSFYVDEDSREQTNKKYCTFVRDRALAEAVNGRLACPDCVQCACGDKRGGDESETLWDEGEPWAKQRDYNRIVQSRAFRRMVDKAQIYGSEQGVLYRTRMTHTLIVARIARQIARQINEPQTNASNAGTIDELLTETIALAHDMGHTPFGHQGERTLDEKLKEHCGEVLGGGFKHNYQSVRVMSYLEESYPSFMGMNVSWKVLEGALHHTKTRRKVTVKTDDGKETKKAEYICNFFELDPVYWCNKGWFDGVLHDLKEDDSAHVDSSTPEGQIVAIADEIAQRSHDIDDGIMSGRIDCNQFVDGLSRFGFAAYAESMKAALDEVDDKVAHGRIYTNELDVKRSVLSEKVIDLLVEDTVSNSGSDGEQKPEIRNSPQATAFMEYLERVVNKHVLSSQTVASFDVNAESIVGSLYDRLLANPFLMPPEVLRRFYVMQVAAGMKDALDFSNCDFDARRKEMDQIRGKKGKGQTYRSREDEAIHADDARRNTLIDKVKNRTWDAVGDQDAYLLKWVYLNRVIADYIGEMTDAMAKEEYKRICQYS